jgi:hypothetical protein
MSEGNINNPIEILNPKKIDYTLIVDDLGGNNSTRYTTTIYNKNNEEILRIEIQCV